jgi:hypothetical protein
MKMKVTFLLIFLLYILFIKKMTMSSSRIHIFNIKNNKILTLKVIQETPVVKAKVIKIFSLCNQIGGCDVFDMFSFLPFCEFRVGHIYTIKRWDKTKPRFTGTIIKDFAIYRDTYWFAAGFEMNFKNGFYHGFYKIDVLINSNEIEYRGYFYNGLPHRYVEENLNGPNPSFKKLELKKGRLYGQAEIVRNGNNSTRQSDTSTYLFSYPEKPSRLITYHMNGLRNGVEKVWNGDTNTITSLPFKNNKEHGFAVYKNMETGLTIREMYRNGSKVTPLKHPNIVFRNKIKIY